MASSDEENIRPLKQSRVEKKKHETKNKISDETTDIINETIQDSQVNERMETPKTKRVSVKRKLEDQDEEINKTITTEEDGRLNKNRIIYHEGRKFINL